MTMSMVKEKKLPHTLWGEDIATAAYVLNSCPTKKLKEIFLFDKWYGDKLNVGHLRVFGFVCYKHVSYAKKEELG